MVRRVGERLRHLSRGLDHPPLAAIRQSCATEQAALQMLPKWNGICEHKIDFFETTEVFAPIGRNGVACRAGRFGTLRVRSCHKRIERSVETTPALA